MMDRLTNLEFYNTPEGSVMVKPVGQPAYELKETHRDVIDELLALVRDRYPKAHAALMELYSKSTMNRPYFEYRAVHRFVRCNFGGYDQNRIDIDHRGALQFEEVSCPLRGECRHEGVICRPELETRLTEREMEVFRLVAANLRTEDIAEELNISPRTVNRHRENIKAKTGTRSVAEMITYWHGNGMR